MTAAVIRPARPEDARGIAEVHVASWRAAYAGLIPQQVLDDLSVDRREQMWREAASSGRSVLLIAAAPAGILGFFSGGASRDEDAGATGELWVLDTNSRARAFYERQDWRLDGAEKDESIDGADVREIRYRRALS